jgi:disulfide bond formation protein DsbB
MSSPPELSASFQREPPFTLWLAMFVGLAALAGSLYLSIGMGLKACPLCYYQRTFLMSAVAVLVMGMFIRDLRPSALSALALPLSAAGLFIAGWHEYLEVSGVLECPAGVLGVGTAPQQSLAALLLLTVLLGLDLIRQRVAVAVLVGLVLGGFLAFASVRSASSAVPNYNLSVDEDMCRVPDPQT